MKKTVILQLINKINIAINRQLNQIIHHSDFQNLEANWRSLKHLCYSIPKHTEKNVVIKIMSCTKIDLYEDLVVKSNDFDETFIFAKIYSECFDHPGGIPFSVIVIADYFNEDSATGLKDQAILSVLSQTAASTLCPIISAAGAFMAGIEQWCDLQPQHNLAQYNDPFTEKWNLFKKNENSRYINLCMPRSRIRSCYQDDVSANKNDFFKEDISSNNDILWGNSAFVLLSSIIDSFIKTGWFASIESPLRAASINPIKAIETDINKLKKEQAIEVVINDRQEDQLNAIGYCVLREDRVTKKQRYFKKNSIALTARHNDSIKNMENNLNKQLSYLLCACRIGQTIKIIGRDKIGRYTNSEAIQTIIQHWLLTLCSNNPNSSTKNKRYPLKNAIIEINEKKYSPGKYYCKLKIQAHNFISHFQAYISIETDL